MSEHEHLDPRLDDAFAALTRDLTHAPSPGAAAAISTARRHRRTRVGGVALAALLAVGGGLTVPGLVGAGDGVASGGGSARLDRDALAAATDGWIGEWEDWERYSPWGGGGFDAESCRVMAADTAPEPAQVGVSRFVSHSGSSATLVVEQYADGARAESAQELSGPAPDTCGTTTTYDVDGVEVRHDSMPPDGDAADDMWLGDVWSARIGDARAELQVVNDTGVADDATAERVAETLVAGLRDGWTQQPQQPIVDPAPGTKVQLPSISEDPLREALAGWRGTAPGSGSAELSTPCLRERVDAGAATSSAAAGPDGLTWIMAGFEDETSGQAQVEKMVDQLSACKASSMSVRRLATGVVVATYGDAAAGRGALWLAATGDRALVVGLDGANGPMPDGVADDVAGVVMDWLRQPAG